jgi:hypothetical protein
MTLRVESTALTRGAVAGTSWAMNRFAAYFFSYFGFFAPKITGGCLDA